MYIQKFRLMEGFVFYYYEKIYTLRSNFPAEIVKSAPQYSHDYRVYYLICA